MKVAILLTGFLREFGATAPNLLKNLADNADSKIFISTWNIANIDRKGKRDETRPNFDAVAKAYDPYFVDYVMKDIDLYQKRTVPIKPIARDNDVLTTSLKARNLGPFWVNRLRDQWYLVSAGLDLIQQYEKAAGEKFDIIVRTRTDFRLDTNISAENSPRLILPAHFENGQIWEQAAMDFFAMGPRDHMLKLGELSSSIEMLYRDYNVMVNYAESLLHTFLVYSHIPYENRTIKYKMMR